MVLEEIPEDAELRRAWNELALRMERPEVFYTYEWAVAVQRAYGDSRKPLLVLAYENRSPLGLVAFSRENSERRRVSFLSASTADYCDFLSAPGRRGEFVELVFRELQTRTIDQIVLTNLPADSCSVAAISNAASKVRYHLHLRSAYLCARVVLGSEEQRWALKQATAGKKRLRRNFRELEKTGQVCIQHDMQWEQIEPNLQSFSRAHVARFLSTGRISSLISSERRKFLCELARELSSSGWVALSRMLVGEIPVAWNYGFRFANSWFWYQPTVESSSEFADFSPGYCLLAKIVELACEHPEVEIVDMGLGAEEYKDRFATTTRETLYCGLNRSVGSHLHMVARDKAAEIAKASPEIEGYLRGIISYVAGLRTSHCKPSRPGLVRRFGEKVRSFLGASDEVRFFKWNGRNENGNECSMWAPLNSDLLGAAAIRYADDPATMDYLMRAAKRFRSENGLGFASVGNERIPLHFCWAKDFEGFELAELGRKLRSPEKNAVLIFDCYSAVSGSGPEDFAEAIAVLAEQFREQGKAAWAFCSTTNHELLKTIEESGFIYRFSLGRKRVLFIETTKDSIAYESAIAPPARTPS